MISTSNAVLLVAACMVCRVSSFAPKPLYEFVNVTYDFRDSPWHSAANATEAGAYVIENNIITGVNEYMDMVFVCVPRWRPGVPSTLNVVIPPGPGESQPVLKAWPSWEFNLETVRYVQSVWVDQKQGQMYVIDAGRENFFSGNPDDVVNGYAKLLVLDIESQRVVYSYTFADDIFSTNSSFLNDVVVDESRRIAYMSDTNVAGLGGVVMHDLNTGHTLRFDGPSTLADPWYTTKVLNVSYSFNSPADGITLSSDGDKLFYSVIEGVSLFSLDAAVFRDPSSTKGDVQDTVQNVTQKASFSNGLHILPARSINEDGTVYTLDRLAYGSIGACGIRIVDMKRKAGSHGSGADSVVRDNEVLQNDTSLQWTDTFAYVPFGDYSGALYFTTNRLQRYFVRNWDPSGGEGANMRVFRVDYDDRPQAPFLT